MATKGTVKIDNVVCNVTKLMEAKGKGEYTSLQGYTISSNYIHMLVMLSNKDTTAVLARGEGQTTVSSLAISDSKYLKHGNDCAFNKNFLIAQGGGEDPNTTIKCFNSSFNLLGQYTYQTMAGKNPLNTVSCLAYISGNYFFLGSGKIYAVCSLDETNKIFQEVSRVSISDEIINQLKRTGCTLLSQGIYYAKNKLYKVYSHKDSNNKILRNDIVIYDLPGSSPKFNGKVSLNAVYACDRIEKELFEIESISSPDNGNSFYMATNQMENSTTQKDCIYKIILG